MKGKIIDITTGISIDTPVYDGDPVPEVEKVSSIEEDGFVVSRISIGTHTGTHVDAPSHIFKDGISVDAIYPGKLMGKAVLLDLSSGKGHITADELERHYLPFVGEDDVSVLLIRTEAGPSSKNPLNSERLLAATAGEWILEHGFSAIGVDNLTIDAGSSLPNHHLLLSNEVGIVEYLHLCEVIEGVYYFICLPLKAMGCDGAPARAILIDDPCFG
ncbi:cyclase family protein [Methanolobus sp. WCC4]|uniref:cyclase family protein n=1 Tax=Methanolobus sp. WCC4 TaxID=3125784 RepID=UPI0030F662B7